MKTMFCELLEKSRKKRGLTQTHVAARLEISKVYYSEVEKGSKPPFPVDGKVDYTVLAKMLGVKKETLVRLSGRTTEEGSAELRDLIMRAMEILYDDLDVKDRGSFDAAGDRGPGGLVTLAEMVTGRIARGSAA